MSADACCTPCKAAATPALPSTVLCQSLADEMFKAFYVMCIFYPALEIIVPQAECCLRRLLLTLGGTAQTQMCYDCWCGTGKALQLYHPDSSWLSNV